MRTFLLAFAVVSSWCLAAPQLTILGPNGGEMLPAGTVQVITWEPADEPVQIRISYSPDNGNSWFPVATVSNTGAYEWMVPIEPSELCMIMIDDPADPSNVWDISDGVFVTYVCSRALSGDINGDCYVDLQDVAEMSANWLVCSNPYDLKCPCAAPFADCDGWAGNGCEVDLSMDLMNCGVCGNACSLPHAYVSCVDGDCLLESCQPGYYDCDGNPANGCEGVLTDPYENNDSFGAARNLGTVAEFNSPQNWAAQIVPAGDEDWYRVYLQEGPHTCFPGTGQEYVIQVRLIPPQGASCVDYDVYLYSDSGQPLAVGNAAGCAEELIAYPWDGTCGGDDSRYFRIQVSGYNEQWNCTGYTLQMDMFAN